MPERLITPVRDIMRRDVPTLARETTVQEAVRFLAERDAPCAVIVEEGDRPVGIVTEYDFLALARDDKKARVTHVLRAMLQEEHHFFDSLHELRRAAARDVGDVMSAPAQCVEPDKTVADAAAMMETYDFRQLPVVEAGRLVGLVTRQDIVRSLARKT